MLSRWRSTIVQNRTQNYINVPHSLGVGIMVGQRRRQWPVRLHTNLGQQNQQSLSQPIRTAEPMPMQCWSTVCDARPTSPQHRLNSSCPPSIIALHIGYKALYKNTDNLFIVVTLSDLSNWINFIIGGLCV